MLNLNQPPQHSPDDEIVWVFHMDPCWDSDRVKRERDILRDACCAKPEPVKDDDDRRTKEAYEKAVKARAEASSNHPVVRWRARATRFSLDAPLTVPEELRTPDGPATVTIAEYWTSAPTQFILRDLSARHLREVEALHGTPAWCVEVVKRGLGHVLEPESSEPGAAVTRIDPPRDAAGLILEEWIDKLDRRQRLLLEYMAQDIFALRVLGGDATGKP